MHTEGNPKALRIVKIIDVIKENKGVCTLTFSDPLNTHPGQFVMVWIPGVDEIPMSISINGETKGMTIKAIGKATTALNRLSPGAKVGIRGPYGTYFEKRSKDILVVAGGIGIAPILPFIEGRQDDDINITVALGAITKDELVFENRLKEECKGLFIATDDGSAGFHGFVTDLAMEIAEKQKIDEILTCGPEIMILKMVEFAKKNDLKIQASLERYMKCGVGICDSCAINGYHICRDGPVFSEDILFKLNDLGKFKRDVCGRKVNFCVINK